MKRTLFFIITSVMISFMTGCGDGQEGSASSTTTPVVQGWHNQGRDCLACHNVDLQDERRLTFGGTVYKNQDEINTDDINNVCGGDLIVNFWDSSHSNLLYSSKNYVDPNSKGNRGKGNIFILQRQFMPNSLSGNLFFEITDANSNVLTSYLHQFSGQEYDIAQPTLDNNRISCNSCHTKNGAQPAIYVDSNKINLCK